MLILALDTTMAACSVALVRDGTVLAADRETMDQGQAEALMPMIEDVMARAQQTYAGLDRIAVTVGPGSFTGVRVGLAAARGLGLAAEKPVVGLLTTEVLAAAAAQRDRLDAGTRVLVAIDTKRGDIYAQAFDHLGHETGAPVALAADALAAWLDGGDVLVVGDASATAVAALGARARLSTADSLPDASVLARLAAERAPSSDGPLPVYVRAPDAVVPAHGGRLRA